jgi:uncharacterized membrane protein YhhN
MTSIGGFSSATDTPSPYARPRTVRLWGVAALVAAGYGVFLIVTALRLPAGSELTGQFAAQPALKAAAAASSTAAGDFLLAIPWWEPSFVLGLASFLIAHLCFLAALIPLATRSAPRLAAVAATMVACAALLVWFWPHLVADGMAVPVTAYIAVLGAMVCAALLAKLPTPWTALGAVTFAVSDAMIGIGRFILRSEALAVPIWWAYAASLLLITAGFFFGRTR